LNKFFSELGDFSLFLSRIARETFSRNFEFREFLRQCYLIGYKTLPLVSVTKAAEQKAKDEKK
jgi:phospholipid/cholesterol/gamma-HCH transport system permease protein